MISIIIPVFNQSKYLRKCLNSILEQTYQNFEIIVVDDGSGDNSLEIANGFYPIMNKKNITYKVIAHKKNMGAPTARNTGFKEARGEYLFFCDSDAVLYPDFFDLHLSILKNNPLACYSYSNFYWGKKLFISGKFDEERLRREPFIHTMALVKKNCFPFFGWDESIKKFQDWDLWLSMLEEGKKGIWIDKILFKVYPGGVISTWLPSFAYKFFPFLPQVKKYKNAEKIIKNKHKLF